MIKERMGYLFFTMMNKKYLGNTHLRIANGMESAQTIFKMAIYNRKEILKITMESLFSMIKMDRGLHSVNTKIKSLMKEMMLNTFRMNLIKLRNTKEEINIFEVFKLKLYS